MTQVTYSGLTPGAPENVNDLNAKLIELKGIINGNLDAGNLAAASVGTSELIDGSVTAAKLASAVGAPLAVTSQVAVGNTGQTATGLYPGRTLAAADFTGLGLSAPVALYGLASVSDSSGNGRTLTNKGAVTFDIGITGSASTAALFTGSTGQALYFTDTGAADPFRIKTGSIGCWFRTAKRATNQQLMAKWGVAGQSAFELSIQGGSNLAANISSTGADVIGAGSGVTDVCDDRWHHCVLTLDGTLGKLYVDGVLEGSAAIGAAMFGGSSPFDIGIRSSDATNTAAGTLPHYGRIDEAFVTTDILSDDQIRFLYCSKIAHAYPSTPKQTWVEVRRQKRGAALATTDFPSTPVRLHNLAAGALTDLGSGGVSLTANNTPLAVAGPDGLLSDAYNFVAASTQSLSATDAGLPSGTSSRSYGCWLKTPINAAGMCVMGWGTLTTNDARIVLSAPTLQVASGPDIISCSVRVDDGQWHHIVVVEDNAPVDGIKRRAYVDGRLVGVSTVLTSLTLAGANRFRIAANPDGTAPFTGQVSRAFVHSVALTAAQVAVLYDKSSQQLTNSPKNEGDHIEGMDSTYLYLDTSGLPSNSLLDIQVQG